jgi:hypothetical protein
MVTRSTPAIVLGPTGNQQGTYKFLSLTTGKKIKRQQMTKYPMPDSVVKQVKKLAHRAVGTFDFTERNRVLFKWNKEVNDNKGLVEEEPIVAYPLLVAEFPGITATSSCHLQRTKSSPRATPRMLQPKTPT